MLTDAQRYEIKKSKARETSRRLSLAGREISGRLPARLEPWPVFADAAAFASAFSQTPRVVAEVLHAALSGRYGCVALLGHTQRLAGIVLQAVCRELESSDPLCRAFPEVCHVMRAMGGVGQRRPVWRGDDTGVQLLPNFVRLNYLPENRADGCRLIALKKKKYRTWEPQEIPVFDDDDRPAHLIDL